MQYMGSQAFHNPFFLTAETILGGTREQKSISLCPTGRHLEQRRCRVAQDAWAASGVLPKCRGDHPCPDSARLVCKPISGAQYINGLTKQMICLSPHVRSGTGLSRSAFPSVSRKSATGMKTHSFMPYVSLTIRLVPLKVTGFQGASGLLEIGQSCRANCCIGWMPNPQSIEYAVSAISPFSFGFV